MFKNTQFGMTSFTASLHKVDECELNGLPRLPHSINILGRFEQLKHIQHRNLCKYLDVKRDKHERILLAIEFYAINWEIDYPTIKTTIGEEIVNDFLKLVSAVEYLHNRGITVRNIAPKNIYWTKDKNRLKLGNYGIYYVTNCGLDIDFPIGEEEYLPPEALISNSNGCFSCPRSDVWSVGVLLLKSFLLDFVPSLEFSPESRESHFDVLKSLSTFKMGLDSEIGEIVHDCLIYDVFKRLSIYRLKQRLIIFKHDKSVHKMTIDCQQQVWELPGDIEDVRTKYYLWGLAGGDLWRVYEKLCDYEGKLPAILTLPIVVKRDGEALWSSAATQAVKRPLSDIVCPLSLDKLTERLDKLKRSVFLEPRLEIGEEFKPFDFSEVHFRDVNEDELIRFQPIWVKETDFEYQFRRIIKFRRLLRGFPLTKNALFKESSFDIPPLLRAEIWPLLLGVDEHEAFLRYMHVQGRLLNEKSASQISVDLPRCHSYDELIVSNTGQSKLGRILHAWLIHHPGLEYTQGMDSLCAVFTRLMYNNEALAFACLEAFVDKFMNGLFCSSHGQALTEYCTILQHLLSFHKPNLSQAVNIFSITGFTASWIYTGFAHSLPIDKTIRLWDTVILGEPSFLMMVFIALLGQLDHESGFSSQATEQVFSVLSNLPEFDLDRCRLEAIDLAKRTPSSATKRYVSVDFNVVTKSTDATNNVTGARISLDDLLLMIGEAVTEKGEKVFSPFAFDPNKLPTPILIDLRKKENFEKGSVPGSLNIPVVSASPHTTLAELESRNARAIIGSVQSSVKVIISTVDDHICDMVAKILINTYRLQYVCVLKGGINEVRSKRPDILIVTH